MPRILQRRVIAVSRVGATLLMALVLMLPMSAPTAAAIPSQLPTHFAFGVSVGQGDTWMPQTGIPWDYRMQYLVGGVNTGSGWETWNSNGTFALNYATESAQHGYIPMFPYYEILQSNGSCGSCGENQKDITNLNTPSLMNAYYGNFALLMQRLGPGNYGGVQGFGKTALVDIEPDFSGGYAVQAANNNSVCFGYCTGQGNDPTFLKASVASSGNADVAAYPNTYAGFVQALAHLRDKYAPNVVLGLDVSAFATGDDIGLDSDPNTNVAALGQQVGTFLGKAGPHDILFNNPLDRDAGQYKALYGQNRWWDRLNVSLPNFHRWEQYLQGASTADGGKSMMLWQVPVGNQYFDTENDTNNHYQDNRPEYIFNHVPELIQNGIIGAIFASGNSGNTTYTDASGDGITNPASFCTTDGSSSGQICNNHTSTVSDDDGGYIRMMAQNYYKSPVSLSGGGSTSTSTPTPTPTVAATYTTSATTSPTSAAPGQTVTINTSVKSSAASTVLVDVEVYDPSSTKVFQQSWDQQSFTAGQTRTFASSWQLASTAASGSYTIDVGVFSPGWGTLYSWQSVATESVGASASPTNTPTAAPTNTPTSTPTRTPTPTNTPVPTSSTVRVNSGGAAYTGGGNTWQADTAFSGGQVGTTSASISGTSDPTLYQTERYGNFTYTFNVPNGNYNVVLKFAEIYWSSAGQRVFNVSINGQPVLSNFDILANVAKDTALDKTFSTTVSNGTLTIAFTTVKDNAKVSAIQITPATTSIRVNSGGPAYTGSGNTWQADTSFSGGQVGTTSAPVSGTTDPTLYQTERYGNFTYTFNVPNGNYNVVLKFAEIYWSTTGQRVFNVSINGQSVLSNFDILANVAKDTALDKTFSTTVSNGTLTITFSTVKDNAKVSAIEIDSAP